MQFRRSIVAAIAAVLIQALPALADDMAVTEEIKAAKTALDAAFQNQDGATIERMVTADHMAVTTYYGQPFTTADELATLSEFDATYSDFTEPKVTILGPDAALITFANSFEGTFQGRDLPPRVFVSEIWLRQDGAWRQDLYQETPIGRD